MSNDPLAHIEKLKAVLAAHVRASVEDADLRTSLYQSLIDESHQYSERINLLVSEAQELEKKWKQEEVIK